MVWLLILINLGLFTYFNASDLFDTNQAVKTAQISPEKIVLLSDEDVKSLPKKVPETTSTSAAADLKMSCYEWGSFSKVNLSSAQAALAKLSVASSVKSQSPQEALHYWIYIPPLKSHAAAEDKVTELNALGITDIFIVQEPKWKDAISLGVFSDEKLATQHLEDLKKKGLTSVAKRVRNEEQGHASLLTAAVSSTVVKQINTLKADFLGSELKKIECKVL